MKQKNLSSIPFSVECVFYADSVTVNYVIVRDPHGYFKVENTLREAALHISDYLDEFVFSKNKKDEKS